MKMPLARGSGGDSVSTGHGCDATTTTDQCSSNVFVNGKGMVRYDDANKVHLYPMGICSPHSVTLSTFENGYSYKVFANGKNVARKGDKYGEEEIKTGSPNVNCG